MNDASRARIIEYASIASWLRFAAGLPELAAARAGPEAVIDWLEACWPRAKAEADELLRALRRGPWRVARAPAGATAGSGRASVVVEAGKSAWVVRLQAGASLVASRVERSPAGGQGSTS